MSGRAVRRMPARQRPLKIWVKSLGCPKNRVDTEKLLGQLGAVQEVEQAGRADVVLLNTCGFIEPAVRESIRSILDLADECAGAAKRPLLAVAGCLVGRYGVDSLAGDLPEVDLWLEPARRDDWGRLIMEAVSRAYAPGERRFPACSYAYLKISEGCRHRCAFCTIPSIRGPLRSAEAAGLVAEARSLARQGAKELVLVAQDLTDYGHDLGMDEHALPDLLRALGDVEGVAWLRMLYLYPNGVTPELLRTVRDVKALLPYFDMPLQHSHPDILRSMGRPFAVDAERVCMEIREALPDAALRTTFIVGYPGETDEHFEHLCRFVERVRFANMGVFPYWAEEGTRAAALPGQVEDAVKQERLAALMELQQEISREYLERQQGGVMDVLVDEPNDEWPGLYEGRVWFQAPEVDGRCYVSGPGVRRGAMVRADIVESSEYDLVGLAVEDGA